MTGCELCDRKPGDRHLLDLWETRQIRSPQVRLRQVEKLLNDTSCLTPALVKTHFEQHPAPQPIPAPKRAARNLDDVLTWLPQRKNDLALLRFIGQARVVTADQIAAIFWPSSSKRRRSDRILAQKKLNELAAYHLVWGAKRTGKGGLRKGEPRKVWYLGRTGALVLDKLGPELRWSERGLFVSEPPRQGHLRHDIGVTDSFVSLMQSAEQLTEFKGMDIEAFSLPANYWTENHLTFEIHVPKIAGVPGQTKTTSMRPDALFSLSIRALGAVPSPAFASLQMPCFEEHDRTSHPIRLTQRDITAAKAKKRQPPQTTTEEIVAYFYLCADRADVARFPEVDVEGYSIPMLFEVQGRGTTTDIGRARAVIRGAVEAIEQLRLLDYLSRKGIKHRPSIAVVCASDRAKYGYHAPVFDIWKGDDPDTRIPFIDFLTNASLPLIESGRINVDTLLDIDPEGAVWRAGATAASYLKVARSRQQHAARAALAVGGAS